MSEAAARPAVTASVDGHSELLLSLGPLLREWLPRQRWFAGKGRPVTGFTIDSVTPLLPRASLLHLLLRAHQPPADDDGPGDCYQLLIGTAEALAPHLASAAIGHMDRGPLAGRVAYEALQDPRQAAVLLERLRRPGALGALRFHRGPYGQVPRDLAPRPLQAEQSNSSVVYGDQLIAKLFRRVLPGTNPDLELPLALAREGCDRVPAPVAWFETADGETTLGLLQPFLDGAADGWELALKHLTNQQDFTYEAHELGRATAEVHTALAHALPTVTYTRAQTEQLAAAMTRRLESTAQQVPALHPYVPALRTAFDALADLAAGGHTWQAQRVHGDLHLGQCLRAPNGAWRLIDFEGEPSRPLAERRMPHPAHRDIAGMLRSFDYAARSHRPWSPAWSEACRAAYCTGYAESSGWDPRTDPVLLRAYETDKAIYEALYEARHRPDWLPVPMAALARLAEESKAP
ncbi:maltokinase [Streptomyces sp. VRA16 Mangrove soil]|uniref:maltokinase N-terminal cap-like domain-containing protein n=1 Tax=Streptomyces sp. VRA16 Mangrove soil TaxID=2817434 RepID=UPI001A9E4867|nr:maltokinase [Streptomyces sp. VRA16 Mangrove soil]MBO1336453.1 maltokinase [Streptomyces sp. VRA16 Mangrove soil]